MGHTELPQSINLHPATIRIRSGALDCVTVTGKFKDGIATKHIVSRQINPYFRIFILFILRVNFKQSKVLKKGYSFIFVYKTWFKIRTRINFKRHLYIYIKSQATFHLRIFDLWENENENVNVSYENCPPTAFKRVARKRRDSRNSEFLCISINTENHLRRCSNLPSPSPIYPRKLSDKRFRGFNAP